MGTWSSQIALVPSCKTQGWHFPALPAVLGCKPFSLSHSLQTQLWPGPSRSPVSYTSCGVLCIDPLSFPLAPARDIRCWFLLVPSCPPSPTSPKTWGAGEGNPICWVSPASLEAFLEQIPMPCTSRCPSSPCSAWSPFLEGTGFVLWDVPRVNELY